MPRLEFPDERRNKVPDWRLLADSGYVREKFLTYNPDDIAEINDLDSLDRLRSLYFPSSQPRNLYEKTYLALMIEAINNQMYPL